MGLDQAHVGTWFQCRPPDEQGQGRAHHRREIALRNPAHIDKGAGNPATRVRAAQPVDDRRGRMQVAKDIVAAITGEDGIEARSEEHTSELKSLMRISYAVFCL